MNTIRDIITETTIDAMRPMKMYDTTWAATPGVKIVTRFNPVKRDGNRATRATRHEIHVWEDHREGTFIISVFAGDLGNARRYFHSRNLTAAEVNATLREIVGR